MCIAFPLKIKELLPEAHAIVESDGVERRVSVRLIPDASVGDYVLVHAGYAIEKLTRDSAAESIAVFDELKRGMGR